MSQCPKCDYGEKWITNPSDTHDCIMVHLDALGVDCEWRADEVREEVERLRAQVRHLRGIIVSLESAGGDYSDECLFCQRPHLDTIHNHDADCPIGIEVKKAAGDEP